MLNSRKFTVAIASIAVIVVACGGSVATPSAAPIVATPSAPPVVASASPAAVPSAAVPVLDVKAITDSGASFSAMAQLKDLAAAGKGLVGVILPDATSSGRYISYDAPYLKQAFLAAGYTEAQFKIDNAQGTDATELALAQADITAGAKVLLVDPLNSTVGNQIQALADQNGVKMISYDRATFQGKDTYYISFDNVQVGKLIGQGFVDCVKAWNVKSPKVFTLNGGQDVDPNAIDFAKGYNSVIWGKSDTPKVGQTNSDGYTLVGDQVAPGWDNAKGGAIFTQAYTANKAINATVEANDGLANAVIVALKKAGVPAKTIPTVGQDATIQGMQNVLQNFQCGSVYKPIYLEAQAAVALATYLRAGQTPPSGLVNGTTADPKNPASVQPAVLLVPYWVNAANMQATVIKDKFIPVKDLCDAVTAAVCTAAGIQ